MKIALSIEASTTLASVCLAKFDESKCSESQKPLCDSNTPNPYGIEILGYQSSLKQKAHSEFLNEAIQKIFIASQTAYKDIDVIFCGNGPGSFTGIRVAGAIAKTFGSFLQRPLVSMDSLRILAAQAGFPSLCVPMINAHKNMIYWSCFQGEQQQIPPRADFVSDIPKIFATEVFPKLTANEKLLCIGDGFKLYQPYYPQDFIERISLVNDYPMNSILSDKKIQFALTWQTADVVLLDKPNLNVNNLSDRSVIDYPNAVTLVRAGIKKYLLNETLEWNLFLPLYLRASEAEESLARNAKQE